MKTPLISVIIPIYNVEKYLERCLHSIRNQTLCELEIILVDDESPDNCPSMCDEYAEQDERIKVIHKKNGGLGYARNSGIEIATGKYVAFIDSDDFIDLNMMERLYYYAEKYNADVVRSGVKFFNDGQIIERRDVQSVEILKGEEAVRTFTLDFVGPLPHESREVKYFMSVCLSIYKRAILEHYNIRFESERVLISEDTVFNVDFLLHADCVVLIPESFYYYDRTNTSSLTHSVSFDKYNKLRILFAHLQKQLSNSFSVNEYQLHLYRRQFLELRNAVNGFCHSNFKQSCSDVKKVLNDNIWNDLLCEYPYYKLPFKKHMYFWLLKKKCILMLVIINKLGVIK